MPRALATPGVINTVSGFSGASGVTFSPDGTFAYITNRGSTTVSKLDLSSNSIVSTINVGSGPIGVAIAPDGSKAYVTNGRDSTISVVDVASGTEVGTIPSGSNVFRVVFNAAGTRAYVGVDGADQAQIIDATLNSEMARISVGNSSGGVALTPDEATLYVSAWSDGDVSIIDLSTNTVRKRLSIGPGAMGVAAHPDGSKVYVSSSRGVSIIDTETEVVVGEVAGVTGTYPLAIAPDGGEVYAASGGGTVYVIDTATATLTRTISTGGAYQIAVSPDCSRVIAVSGSRATIIDTERDCSPKSVSFDANSGSGSMSAQSGSSSSALTSNSFTRTGYTFSGWNTSADGSGTAYADGASYDFAADVTLYAQWNLVSVTFDANSGSGSMSAQSGSSPSALTSNSFTRVGYQFSGWNTSADGSGTAYADGASYDFVADLTLYAQWTKYCVPSETSDGSATILSFTQVETCLWTSPARAASIVYLIVGGGGGGGGRAGGGGHGGEVSAGELRLLPQTEYAIVVGAGGNGSAGVNLRRTSWSSSHNGTAGGLSSALGVVSAGGVAGSYGGSVGGTGAGGANSGKVGGRPEFSLIRGVKEWFAGGGGGAEHYSPGTGGVGDDGTLAGGNPGNRYGSLATDGYTFGSGGGGGNYGGNGGQTNFAGGSGKQGIVILRLLAEPENPSVSRVDSSAGGDLVVVPGVPAAQGRGALEAPRRGGLLVRSAPAVIDREVLSDRTAAPSEAVALVGGEEVAVSAQTRGSQFAQFATGKVSLDITVAENHGVVDAVNGAPALKVARNSPASLAGAGLLPNSKLQVFLPASDGSFIEMPALEVNAEGAFEGSLTFGTSPRSKPMPIGQRFIQIVGLDEDGIETVLDIPVTIAQPLPAPEANRVNGERPVLELGQTLALNAGAPETVNVRRSSSATSVEGDGWVFTVETDAPDTTLDAMSLTRDAPLVFSGEGFMPGTRADVWLFSDPTLLGTVDIKEDGTFTALFAVDSAFVPTGNHTLQIQGVGDDGFVRAANLGVQVVDPLDTPIAPVGGQRFDLIPLAVMGTAVLGLAVLTATVIAVGRRRKPMTGPRPAI